MNHVPVAIGLVLCEQVIVDVASRNVTPVNCFRKFGLNEIPGTASFSIVAWLADGLGEMPVQIIVRGMNSKDEVFRMERLMRFDDPLKDMRFTARIRDCPIPAAGYYEVVLSADGEFVAHRKFQVFSGGSPHG